MSTPRHFPPACRLGRAPSIPTNKALPAASGRPAGAPDIPRSDSQPQAETAAAQATGGAVAATPQDARSGGAEEPQGAVSTRAPAAVTADSGGTPAAEAPQSPVSPVLRKRRKGKPDQLFVQLGLETPGSSQAHSDAGPGSAGALGGETVAAHPPFASAAIAGARDDVTTPRAAPHKARFLNACVHCSGG